MSSNPLEFLNIDFKFRRGFLDALRLTPIKNGTFNITKDSRELFIDIDNTRIKIASIIYDAGSEANIKSLVVPENKIYLASDTFNLLFFDRQNMKWRIVGTDKVENSTNAIYAQKDINGNNIHEYYYPTKTAIIDHENIVNEIKNIKNSVGDIVRFGTEILSNDTELPIEGKKGIIYLVPINNYCDGYLAESIVTDSDKINDIYVELLWVVDPNFGGYYEVIGNTTVNLTNYYNKEEVDNKLSTLRDNITTLISNTKIELVESINNLRTLINSYQSTTNLNINNINNNIGDINNQIANISSNLNTALQNIEKNAENISINTNNITSITSEINNIKDVYLEANLVNEE